MVVSALAAWQPSLSSQAGFAERSGYGEMLAISLGLVAMVCVVAVVLVRALGQRGPGRRGELIEVIARQPLEPRRSLYVVRAGTKTLLLGSSEQGVTMLTELEGVEATSREAGRSSTGAAVGASFGELVRQASERWGARRGGRGGAGETSAPSVSPTAPSSGPEEIEAPETARRGAGEREAS